MKAEKDSDLAQIWDALARRFGFPDEPEMAMRRFDVRKQQDGESLAVFEHSLRILYREAWPKTDIKSSDADSLLRRRFVDGVDNLELQKYLRIHAASVDFATIVSKARHFVDASKLSRMPKKPAIRGASLSVNFQAIIDGLKRSWRRRCTTEAVRRRSTTAKSPTQIQNRLLKIRSPKPDRVLPLSVTLRRQCLAVRHYQVVR